MKTSSCEHIYGGSQTLQVNKSHSSTVLGKLVVRRCCLCGHWDGVTETTSGVRSKFDSEHPDPIPDARETLIFQGGALC